MSDRLSYNERAWAIDLVSDINRYALSRNRPIVRAGGEESLKSGKGNSKNTLYPDVILFGDDSNIKVRHGWELKFPDTSLNDSELLKNAEEKAKRFSVNSFLVWNVNEAKLYVKGNNSEVFYVYKEWGPLGIRKRDEVRDSQEKWQKLLKQILDDLNDFFEERVLSSASVDHIFAESALAGVINEYCGLAATSIYSAANENGNIDAHAKIWWRWNAAEYGKKSSDKIDYTIIARISLTNWVNKFLFCHYLKRFNSDAKMVENIVKETPIEEASEIFTRITDKADFMQVFRPEMFSEKIGQESWDALCEFNEFLITLKLEGVPQDILQKVVESSLKISRRKFAGQYSTPYMLAKLLASLAIENRRGNVIDPCCGTGTIPKASYELKVSKGQTPKDALSTLWASDKFQFPLQLCSIALADPLAMGEVVQIFKKDVFDLAKENVIEFTDPTSGKKVTRSLNKIDTILSNLPFVRFEDIKSVNPDIPSAKELGLDGKSDLFAYIIKYLQVMLEEGASVGVIISNSWLGTSWGIKFREAIASHFHIKSIITSASGKWFENADVVTNILVLSKSPPKVTNVTSFVYTKIPINQWDDAFIEEVSANVLTSRSPQKSDNVNISTYTQKELSDLGKFFIGWSSFFSDVHWLNGIESKLIKASSIFKIARGERRGWNPLFYPSDSTLIEDEYIRPVLKSTKNVETYLATPDAAAFCCSEELGTLKKRKKSGALSWIKKFETKTNGNDKPLPEELKRANHLWYEMKPNTQADLVSSMNPEDRIFVAAMRKRGFVDQRLIRFSVFKDSTDICLCHALLNSLLSLYMIESSGFGRGQGVLDLQTNKLNRGLYMLNPFLLSDAQANKIKELFSGFNDKEVKPLPEELNKPERVSFDKLVLKSFGVEAKYDDIKKSLLELYKIRKSVKENS